MPKYEARIFPKNGILATYWEVYILDTTTGVAYDYVSSYLWSVAQDFFELRKERADYLNKEGM